MRRSPGFTAIALLSIALGVAALTVVYTAVKAVLINPLPYTHSGELVQLRSEFGNLSESQQSHTDWIFWNDAQEIIRRNRTLQSAGIYGNSVVNLAGNSITPPEALYGLRISAGLFPTLGVQPMLGRNILQEEDKPGGPKEMILSYGLWMRRFGGDRNIIGRTVKVDAGEDCLVIGVMPPEFNFPLRRGAARTPQPYVEFYVPLQLNPLDAAADRGALGMVARLRSGVTLVQAQHDLVSISTALSHDFPATNRERTLMMGLLTDRTLGVTRAALWLLMLAAAMFLLISCANVANLLLARGFARQREIAVRIAIGASRSRIIRQFLTESCVLAVAGGLAGYMLTGIAWRILPAFVPLSIPRLSSARVDGAVLAFAITTALLNGLLFGLAPALRAVRRRDNLSGFDLGARGPASGSRDRLREFLVLAEVAISVILVITGGQVLASFIGLIRTDPGFQADRIVGFVVLPPEKRYDTPQKRSAIYKRYLDAVKALPGVESAGTVSALLFSGENDGGFISTRESPRLHDQVVSEIDVVHTEYLKTMGARLLEGRWFRPEEMKESNETVIVDEVAAHRLWPATSAIAKLVCVECTPENPRNWKQVIGVVSSMRHRALEGPPQANTYLSAGAFEHAEFVVVRSSRPAAEVENDVRKAIAVVDPDQPVLLSGSMELFVADSVAVRRFIMALLTVTAVLALVIAAAGVYGVTLFATSRRTQEIGIRIALGATSGNIHRLIFRQGFMR